MSDAILVLNAGSSSLKFTEFVVKGDGALEAVVSGNLEELYGNARFRAKDANGKVVGEHTWEENAAPQHTGALEFLFQWLLAQAGDTNLIAVGHRVVHGGSRYAAPVRVDAAILETLAEFVPLAPLHQPHNLLPIRVIAEKRPDIVQVACFDTAFHQTAPPLAQAFALPASITDRGVRRYGFHGLSYEYIASVLAQHDARAAAGKTVVLHLGNGASMCAMQGGKSVASTMGFTAVDGLPMGTRSGNLDPGVVLYLHSGAQDGRRSDRVAALQEVGAARRIRNLERHARAPRKHRPACETRDRSLCLSHRRGNWVRWQRRSEGSMRSCSPPASVSALQQFARRCVGRPSGSVSSSIRQRTRLAVPRIGTASSRVAAWVIPTNEELMIARHTLALAG